MNQEQLDTIARRLADERGIASFSRAPLAGLTVQQSDDEFDAMLDDSIASIHAASVT